MGFEDRYSIHTGEIREFSVGDYVIFSLVLVVSALVGPYYAYKDRRSLDTKIFMLGGKQMHVFPVAMSLTVTLMSALTLLGTPVEVYIYDTMYLWVVLGMAWAVAGAAHVFIPFFYRLQVTTVFEGRIPRFLSQISRRSPDPGTTAPAVPAV
nr:hypothetical protein BaRGS_032662 [Batillaria attramentaria]